MRQSIFTKDFGKNLQSFLNKKKYSRRFIFVDDNTFTDCLRPLRNEVPELAGDFVIKVYAGEVHKTLQAVEYVWKRLTEEKADRKAVLINLGGGMVCDLGGFAASTYKRGIDFIHIPTTLLGQVDASIGGKQGIDFLNYKNQIGVFNQPTAVFINQEFLNTLPPEQITSGFAEVMKHALIAGGKMWKKIESIENLSAFEWKEIVSDSIDVKLTVVKKDPKEKHLRKVLNFGHTIGHAIESWLMSEGKETLHGYCVATGMAAELYLSKNLCGLSEKKMNDALSVIRKHFPRIQFAEKDFDAIIELMKQDKKNENGNIHFVLLHKFGNPVIDIEADEMQIREALQFVIGEW